MTAPSPSEREPLAADLLDTEYHFYRRYAWCLNAFPTLGEVIAHVREELQRFDEVDEDWHREEVATNVFLLSCSVTDTLDDYLVGDRYDFSYARVVPLAAPVVRVVEGLLKAFGKLRAVRVRRLARWRGPWAAACRSFLRACLIDVRRDREAGSQAASRLASLLRVALPTDLAARRPRIPAAFRTQDLTHHDLLTLGRKFRDEYPERRDPVLVVGLRTAGSYFAPLLHAFLESEGYEDVESVTIRPKKGIGWAERATLTRCARRGGRAIIVDEPPDTGATLSKGLDVLLKAGFDASRLIGMLPVHPSRRDWADSHDFLPLTGIRILVLEPEQWHKHRLLAVDAVERRLEEYFTVRHRSRIVSIAAAAEPNARLQQISEQKFHTRLKRVYELRVNKDTDGVETRYILAKSVGWGWLAYHAFIAGERLAGYVPPILGLRDGILYTEWRPQRADLEEGYDRTTLISAAAAYVAARVSSLGLDDDPAPDLSRGNQHKGFDLLASTLSRSYGSKAAAVLKRGRVRNELARRACPRPTLIDGKMRSTEWIAGATLLKTDFEHHGFGKTELNMTDPAYDLAEAILHFGLSREEETALIDRYVERCGDAGVLERLFVSKLLAGIWAMASAVANLSDVRLAGRGWDFNEQYLAAWRFLTVQTLRFCAGFARPPEQPGWRAPLIVMDLDGVLDKQIFGFPSTTAAGIRAVSLLHGHDFAIALNTARTVAEVKEYCSAYGFVGGVGEYGSVVWDAQTGHERALVSEDSLAQLAVLRDALRRIPGVFLNEAYHHSLRAFTYERSTTVPLPTTMIRNVMAELGLHRLVSLQTFVDTTVLAREVDKGRGLQALLALAGQEGIETIAIGDSESDLAMFRVASRSFAPSHIACRTTARLLGCQIVDRSYQAGFLRSARAIVHPDGGHCDRCRFVPLPQDEDRLFWNLLEVADRSRLGSVFRALLDPAALRAFAT